MKELILYALRRFCMLIPFLIGLTLVAFLLGVLSPGDPALALLTMDDSGRTGCAAPCYGTGSACMDPVWAVAYECASRRFGRILSYTETCTG